MTPTAATPDLLRRGPLALRPDNFVPLARTPWGGSHIGPRFKREVVTGAETLRIGESWEFSLDPAFPSRLAEGGRELADLIREWPEAVFSAERVARGAGTCDILVKLLDAAEPLSLQVHPADDDPDLAPGECGKPESWLVLDAEPGAGIYLGFSRSLSTQELGDLLRQGEAARAVLHFQPVAPGDYFEIQPGVSHAIGAGVTLLEPQRVLAGLTGKTFRLWDWGRLYGGKPRELHLEQGLKLVDPRHQVGQPFVESLRRRPVVDRAGGLEIRAFPANPYYRTTVVRYQPGASARLDIPGGYAALLVLSGEVRLGERTFVAGQPALLPHAALPCTLSASRQGELVLVTPADASPSF